MSIKFELDAKVTVSEGEMRFAYEDLIKGIDLTDDQYIKIHKHDNVCIKPKMEFVKDKGSISDGDHTFDELYHHRAILTALVCQAHKDKCWKSKLHSDGTMFDNYFIVGINTPEGPATYHYPIAQYWNLFDVQELERAPEWDGATADVCIDRLKHMLTAVKL